MTVGVLACHSHQDAINVSRAANSGLRPALMEVETYYTRTYPIHATLSYADGVLYSKRMSMEQVDSCSPRSPKVLVMAFKPCAFE
jgi:hypothetical protein